MPTIYGNERRETENNKKQPPNASRHLCCLRNEKVKIYKRKWKGFINDTINSLPFEMYRVFHNC